jgi:hypothetical protein
VGNNWSELIELKESLNKNKISYFESSLTKTMRVRTIRPLACRAELSRLFKDEEGARLVKKGLSPDATRAWAPDDGPVISRPPFAGSVPINPEVKRT